MNALQLHKFTTFTGKLAKTDAQMIAHSGEALKPRLAEIEKIQQYGKSDKRACDSKHSL